ncbi:outer envelope protein 64, chloroplastic isoform X2 [Brassica napus]|uniref:outer envelope protein 64, chloroplastic isoform X2 n=1 Tax=Brassica napus TaxID=3708 RepID=UPI0020786E27|nr:outer envelope protein 64, chloroplastic isoform X2 [Brassica napus]
MQPKRRHVLASRASNLWVLLGLGIAGALLITKKLKKRVREDFGAFIEKLLLLPPPQPSPPKAPHPLTALSFAVSDLFDVKGYVSGFGHPEWIRTHEAAASTSPVVSVLVEGGATCVGKTVVGEFAFSISGETKHYDTPTNPAAPARIPGGSCSGAAVAVAANLVDFALGIDTVGGVRVPAGYCGVLGFRSSQGIVSNAGIIPVSSSLDAVGWFARDPNTLRRVGHVILQLPFAAQRNPRQIILADDYLQFSKVPVDRISQVVIKSAEKLFGRQALKHENLEKYFEAKVPSLKEFCREKVNGDDAKLTTSMLLANVMQLLQRHEFLQNHGDWINTVNPSIDPAVYSQLCKTPELTDEEIENLNAVRNQMRVAIGSLLKDDGILVIPTMPSVPPKLGSKETMSEDYKNRSSSLLCVASISGCCQVTVPLGKHDKCPVSVSLIARHGGDRFLLDTVQKMYASLQENSSLIVNPKSSSVNTISQEESAEIAKGNQAFKEKQWQKAIGMYSEAIKLNDKNGTYYSNRAAAYLELGSYRQAEGDCTKALTLDKKNIKAYLRRGAAREMLGNFKEAIDDFSYALVLEPNNKRAALSADRLRKVFLQ